MQTKHALSAMTGLALAASGTALAADATRLKWDGVPKTEVTLFYPGQATQEWMTSAAHKAGATGVNEGKSCVACHEGEEADLGKVIVSGQKLEPNPIAGKPGSIKVTVQAAYDIARFTAEDPVAGLPDPEDIADRYPDLDLFHPWAVTSDEAP